MKKNQVITLLLSFICIVSCSKTPSDVISEKEMINLMIDIHKAEAFMDINSTDFQTDSQKMILKQSIMEKHNVDLEKFNKSLDWYAHNLEIYNGVYEKVLINLDNEKKELVRYNVAEQSESNDKNIRKYKSFGDTADIWTQNRNFVITRNLGKCQVPFSQIVYKDYEKGDKYSITFLPINSYNSNINVFLGVEYVDGSYTFTQQRCASEGEFTISVQCDSTLKARKVFGYIEFNNIASSIAYINNINLLRTHIDKNTYNIIEQQATLSRTKRNQAPKTEKVEATKDTTVHIKFDSEANKQLKLNRSLRPNVKSGVIKKVDLDSKNK